MSGAFFVPENTERNFVAVNVATPDLCNQSWRARALKAGSLPGSALNLTDKRSILVTECLSQAAQARRYGRIADEFEWRVLARAVGGVT